MGLTPVQQAALDRINTEGVLYPYNGVSTATVRALDKQELINVEWRPSTTRHGTLGSRGYRGRTVRNWIARSKTKEVTG